MRFSLVNMAKELGFRQKEYPKPDSKMIRYRPYIPINEMAYYLTSKSGYLCHPIIRDKADPVRKLIEHMQRDDNPERFKKPRYPWYENNPNNYSISLPIKGRLGNLELIVRSGSSLTHYWQHSKRKWHRTGTFATGVIGIPILFETNSGDLGIVCKLKNGEVGFWWRDSNDKSNIWFGPSIFNLENVNPLLRSELTDG